MMYRVMVQFADFQDGYYVYNAGDSFPRDGHTVSADRIRELSTEENKLGIPLIEMEKPAPKRKKAKV